MGVLLRLGEEEAAVPCSDGGDGGAWWAEEEESGWGWLDVQNKEYERNDYQPPRSPFLFSSSVFAFLLFLAFLTCSLCLSLTLPPPSCLFPCCPCAPTALPQRHIGLLEVRPLVAHDGPRPENPLPPPWVVWGKGEVRMSHAI